MSVSNVIKRVCYLSGLYLGVPHIFYKLRRRDVVIMYHSIATSRSDYEYGVTVNDLLRHIAIIKKHFRIVPLHEILVPKAGICRAALTFDDALADFYDSAFQVLREENVHATVFVPTAFVGTGITMHDGKPHLSWEQMRSMQNDGASTAKFGSRIRKHAQCYISGCK